MTPRTETRETPQGSGDPDFSVGGVRTRRGRTTGRQARSGLAVGLGGALIVALVATAVTFSIARGTSDVAALGTAGIYEEASLSAAAAARNGTVQAHLIGEAHALGITSYVELAQSLASAEAARDELLRRTELLIGELGDGVLPRQIRTSSETFANAINGVVGLIRGGNLTAAGTAIDSELSSSYQTLAGVLADERDQTIARMALTREDAGRLADAARFLVGLFVPLGVLFAYRGRVRNQQRRRNLEHQLEKQQTVNKTKDEFITNLSHELRTPLTGIYGFALELVDQGPDQDPALSAELARLIAGESAELSRMVDDLLTAATAEQDGLVVVMGDVDPAVEVAAVLAPLAAIGIDVDTRTENALISADRLRVRQIIRNLVWNSHRHGGPHISVVGRIDGNRYAIEVRDNGPGVPTELEERLFTRFIHEGNTPLITGSVGLGLSIAQLLAERMGGTIAYRRENNETVFAVAFKALLNAAPMPGSQMGQKRPVTQVGAGEPGKNERRSLDMAS
ncbi:MAG: sensor histidine kinase [Acidimicrobiia bacterium]